MPQLTFKARGTRCTGLIPDTATWAPPAGEASRQGSSVYPAHGPPERSAFVWLR